MSHQIPIVDLEPFLNERRPDIVTEIGRACTEFGFFCIRNHGVSLDLQKRLADLSREFFSLGESTKMEISMDKGGHAWRGYFPVGGELTSGQPDLKEGLYFGEELGANDPRVQKQWPLHGANLFPSEVPELKETVLEYIAALTSLGHVLMEALSLSLNLSPHYFHEHYTARPTPLFRVFHYPPTTTENENKFPWGVGEHTDYGLLTILQQDAVGGLEVKTKHGWLTVPPLENIFVCNVGDMLDFLSRGRYLSAPHRVKNTSGRSRYSYPFFFDPDFAAPILPLPIQDGQLRPAHERWDKQNLYEFDGTYGEYLLKKVSKVFPELANTEI